MRPRVGIPRATRSSLCVRPYRFGLDCADRLDWRSWQPGAEYAKTLTIRNVSTKAVTFTYRLPQSKAFGMAFPEPVQLLPGMAHALRVTFHPLRREAYEDAITISVAGYSFLIHVAARLPVVRLKVPEQVDFGLCAVAEVRPRRAQRPASPLATQGSTAYRLVACGTAHVEGCRVKDSLCIIAPCPERLFGT